MKVGYVQLAEDIATSLNQEASPFPVPWPHRFRVIEPEEGVRLLVRESEDLEIREVLTEHVCNKVISWMRLHNNPDWIVGTKQAKEAVEIWRAIADPLPLDQVRWVRWQSDPGYTWRRLPWDIASGPTPTWDGLLGKLTNAAAFRQWLGSLFFEEGQQHQYVWVHGMGNDGKGAMNRFFKRVFGKCYRSKQPPHPGDKFWTYGLIGARIVVFPDCNSQGFTAGGLFKTLSGGDPVDVEAKGRMSFTTELQAKYLFFSNERPNISCEDADMRRIIYCEFTEKTKKSDIVPGFEKRLWEEGGFFLSRCVEEYLAACPHHESIKSDQEHISEWVSVVEERWQLFFDSLFYQPIEEYRTTKLFAGLTDEQVDLVTVRPDDLFAVLKEQFPDRRDQGAFRDWMYKKYGVQKRNVRRGGGFIHRYIGVARKPTGKAADAITRAVAKMNSGFRVVATVATDAGATD